MYNDKSCWTDPENFRPERFLNKNDIDTVQAEKILSTVFGMGIQRVIRILI